MANRRQQTVEYKETTVFDLFPEYEYTRRQRSRIILFHYYAKNFKKAINYAANFDVPNKLCLVYLVGAPPQAAIIKALEKAGCTSNVCVLTSPFTDEQMHTYELFDDMRSSLVACGLWDKDAQTFNDAWRKNYADAKKARGYYPDNEVICAIANRGDIEYETEHRYRRLKKACKNTVFKKWTLYRVGCLPKPFTHDRLDELIVRVFPQGTEALQVNDYASLSPASIQAGLVYAETGVENRRLGFELNDDTPAVRALRKYITKALAEDGRCNLNELGKIMQAPPFGMRLCGYASACIAFALKKWENRSLYFVDQLGVLHCATEVVRAMLPWMFPESRRELLDVSRHSVYLMMESHPHKVMKQSLAAIFGVKIQMPGTEMIRELREFVSGEGRPPLFVFDPLLYECLNIGWSWSDAKCVAALAEAVSENVERLRKSYQRWAATCATLPAAARCYFSEAASWAWGPHGIAEEQWHKAELCLAKEERDALPVV